jgi:hypothetical protein
VGPGLARTLTVALAAISLAGCGGNGTSSSSAGATTAASEAAAAAAGDIPDNQVFLTYVSKRQGYSIKYPEGWARSGTDANLTFRDKNNVVHIRVAPGAKVPRNGETTTAGGNTVVKVVRTATGAADPVTGKRLKLTFDRYYVPGPGKHAVVELGAPVGVDNVDAYRLMIESFKWL